MPPNVTDGELIEYIPDRFYLAFLSKTPKPQKGTIYFTIDNTLLYNPFHHDFGPFHVAHIFRFAKVLHDILGDEESNEKTIIFYSHNSSTARSNAAFILSAYMILIQSWPPHLVLAPLAQIDPPFLPWRDAGYSIADFTITLQDCVYGLWRAKEAGLVNIKDGFNLEEYEKYERVENGDFNWVTQHFIAFASPIEPGFSPSKDGLSKSTSMDSVISEPCTPPSSRSLPRPFRHVLHYFTTHDVGLVVRLNSPLYEKKWFTDRGVEHLEMEFEDGTCPDLSTVKTFLIKAQNMIDQEKVVAVHCKAGLGRTGCLIGAYLIYKFGFTAVEVIAFMRILRPGMVVGPQQHWLHINQHHFRAWTHLGLNPSPKKRVSGASRNVSFSTPQRNPLSSIENTSAHDTPLPAPTPGQPRKARDRLASEHKEPVVSVVAETTSDGTKVTVNVTTPDHHDKDGSRGKRAASYAALGKSPSGGGRRVMSRNAENISPHQSRQSELARTASGRGAKRVGSNGSIASVKEGRVRKASGSKERVVSTTQH